jgi:thiol-disulfide isomerase/thioredoxin
MRRPAPGDDAGSRDQPGAPARRARAGRTSARLGVALALVVGIAAVDLVALLPVPGVAATPGAASAHPRAFTLDEAVRELKLIKPPKPKPASDFTLKTPDGKTFKLSEHRGKVVFVNFWATWCPPCLEEMPAMERLYQQHRERLVMVAVSVDADPNVVPPYLKQHRYTFTIGLDSKMQVSNAYSVRALPSSFLVDGEGRLAALAFGPRAWDHEAAHALVAGLGKAAAPVAGK